ncbi:lysine-specific permease [Colletotrichum sp. SAR 10_65]|nr:lysine-specific permease [Colletotrichum sp. SAR 10_65]
MRRRQSQPTRSQPELSPSGPEDDTETPGRRDAGNHLPSPEHDASNDSVYSAYSASDSAPTDAAGTHDPPGSGPLPPANTGVELDFSNLNLTCPINPDDIANRWLHNFVPLPGQTVKKYTPSISAFIYRVLQSYANCAIRGHRVPPFIHWSQLDSPSSVPLSTCLSVIRMCASPHPGSEGVIAEVLQREMTKLYDRKTSFDDMTLLAAFQAYLIYAMVIFFRLGREYKTFLHQGMMNTQDLACETARRGLACVAEQQGARPKWEEWIVAETKRRAVFTMCMFDSALLTNDGLPSHLATELRGLLAPGSKSLWEARDRRDWEVKYNIQLAAWNDGGLRIEELWPMPEGFSEAETEKRRERVDMWLEDLDDIFDKRQKVLIIFLVSTAATFSGFASNIYFPALSTIADDLNVSVELINLTVTTYLIFQGLAPSLWGPISDVKGRKVAYIGTFLVFFGACVGLAEIKTFAGLIILRCVQSMGSASTIAIGSGVIGDITTREERGGFMGVFQAGLLAPVAIGPVIGGALAGSLGWRSIFWFLTIYCGIFLLFLVVLLPETLRSVVGNGRRTPSTLLQKYPLAYYQRTTKVKWDVGETTPGTAPRKKVDLTAPIRILFSKSAAPITVFLAIYYAVWQMSITAMSTLFKTKYGLSDTHIGLTFIANGAGSIIGTLVTGKFLDMDYQKVKAKYGEQDSDSDFPIEKARLRLVPVFALLQGVSIAAFGWTINFPDKVHIAVPIASTFVTGWTAIGTQSLVMTYLVDIFPDRSAAASASLNLARCLFAAGGTSFVMPMVNSIGVGWAFTVCVAAQAIAVLLAGVQWKFAGRWRRQEAAGWA